MDLADGIAGTSVLVTGATGFIGRHLCQRLLSCRAHVHAVSRQAYASHSDHLHWWQADLRDTSAVHRLVSDVQPQIVFHLASHVTGARELQVVLPTFYDNLASTVHLLTAVTEAGCQRIVLAGSSEEPQSSDGNTFPCSPYTAAKWASSIYGRMFHQLFQAPVVMPRIFMTYGPAQRDVHKLVPFVIRRLLRGEAPKLSSGRRLADWIYIDDVVEGLLRAAVIAGIEGCAFDVGSGSLVSVRGIVDQISEIMGGGIMPAYGALPDRPFEQERTANTTFLSDRLGYQPKTALREGLEATVTWYRRELGASMHSPGEDVYNPTAGVSA